MWTTCDGPGASNFANEATTDRAALQATLRQLLGHDLRHILYSKSEITGRLAG